jgi:hypothetical protein
MTETAKKRTVQIRSRITSHLSTKDMIPDGTSDTTTKECA